MEGKERIDTKKGLRKIPKPLIALICVVALAALAFFGYIQPKIITPMKKYEHAKAYLEEGNYSAAQSIFFEIEDYKDSALQIENCQIAYADDLLSQGKYAEALKIYEQFPDNPNVDKNRVEKCKEMVDSSAKSKRNEAKGDEEKAAEEAKKEIERQIIANKKGETHFNEVAKEISIAIEKTINETDSTNEVLTNYYTDYSWYEEEKEGYFSICCNLTDNAYTQLKNTTKGSDEALAYEKLLEELSNYCRNVKSDFTKNGIDAHVSFYIWAPGKGKGQTAFSVSNDEGIVKSPFE